MKNNTNVNIIIKTINAVNFYPDLKKWNLIDSKGKYTDVYNRYYHTEVRLTNEKTSFDLKQADMFILNLNVSDIKKWPVRTIVSPVSYDKLFDQTNIKFKKNKPYEITKDGDTWVVTGKEIERLFNMTKFTEEEGVLRFGRILRAMGVEETLEKMGAKPGDDVAINDYLFTYKG